MWPNNRILKLFGIELPIIQAPMASCVFSEMVVAVSEAGGLGSLPCALLSLEQMRSELGTIRQRTSRPIHVNFFCHALPRVDSTRERLWGQRLQRYYEEWGLAENIQVPSANRASFDDKMCDLVVEFHPEVVSFHFGLPEEKLVQRIRNTGAKIVSSATTVDEARWLEDRGCDAIIAQGYEAGGHRGMFLSEDVSTQAGTIALVPQVADAVKVPVIAAGGIGDARGPQEIQNGWIFPAQRRRSLSSPCLSPRGDHERPQRHLRSVPSRCPDPLPSGRVPGEGHGVQR